MNLGSCWVQMRWAICRARLEARVRGVACVFICGFPRRWRFLFGKCWETSCGEKLMRWIWHAVTYRFFLIRKSIPVESQACFHVKFPTFGRWKWVKKGEQAMKSSDIEISSYWVMEEIPNNHLGYIKPCEYRDIYYSNWCRISSINSMSHTNVWTLPLTLRKKWRFSMDANGFWQS